MPSSILPAGEHHCTVAVGERSRRYLLHLPALEQPPKRWPVVLCFHGGGSNPAQMVEFTGLSDAAQRHGFVVVYPAGTGIIDSALTWNAGNCCGRALKEKVDEVTFVTALLDDLETQLPVDSCRVYATGMSNGGMMAYLVADKLSERVAAIAPVAGTMGLETCSPTLPVPVMHFHGTADEFVPLEGGIGRKSVSKTNFLPVKQAIAQWVQANGCETLPQSEESAGIKRVEYRPRAGGAPVVLYELQGVGHTWPGRESRFQALGRTTKAIDATELMWAFFAQHSRAK